MSPAPVSAKINKDDKGRKGSKDDEHAYLSASFEFNCEQPDKLAFIEIGLFYAFKHIQTIEVQVVGAKVKSKQTSNRPESC